METQRFSGRIRFWNPDKASGLAVVDIPPEHVEPIGGFRLRMGQLVQRVVS